MSVACGYAAITGSNFASGALARGKRLPETARSPTVCACDPAITTGQGRVCAASGRREAKAVTDAAAPSAPR